MPNKTLSLMFSLLKDHDMGVLATSRNDVPHCSLMSYITDERGRTVYMVCDSESTKYKNLLHNDRACLLVDTRVRSAEHASEEIQALTVGGKFVPLDGKEDKSAVMKKLIARHPQLKEFARLSTSEIITLKVESFLLLKGVSEADYSAVE